LIFAARKKQQAVRKIMKRTQPSLCYDIRRIRERIQFIVYLQRVFDIFLDFVENVSDEYPEDMVKILVLMYYTTSFTTAAEVLDKPQIFVRYTFKKALRKMRDLKHWEIYEIFSAIGNNKNKIRRVYKPRPAN